MRAVCASLGFLVLTASGAWADRIMSVCAPLPAACRPSEVAVSSAALRLFFSDLRSTSDVSQSPAGRIQWPGADSVQRVLLRHGEPASEERAIELSPPPRGDVLCLAGILTIGLWEGTRRARGWCPHLPACNQQQAHGVGFHAAPPDLQPAPLWVNSLASPARDRSFVLHRWPDLPIYRLISQGLSAASAPRAPPAGARAV